MKVWTKEGLRLKCVVRQSAVDWLFDSVVRASSSADLAFAAPATVGTVPVKKLLILNPLAIVENVRDAWIAEQVKYHDRNNREQRVEVEW